MARAHMTAPGKAAGLCNRRNLSCHFMHSANLSIVDGVLVLLVRCRLLLAMAQWGDPAFEKLCAWLAVHTTCRLLRRRLTASKGCRMHTMTAWIPTATAAAPPAALPC